MKGFLHDLACVATGISLSKMLPLPVALWLAAALFCLGAAGTVRTLARARKKAPSVPERAFS